MISLRNKGLIDLDAVTTLGVSVKEQNSIGIFGTGIKYGIATLIRNGHEVIIFRGLEKFTFSLLEKTIRGEKFSIICMNGQQLGFTTQLGKQWTIPMAFRELYSNMLDENGEAVRGAAAPMPGWTTIHILGQGFEQCYDKKDTMFLEGRKAIVQIADVEILDRFSNGLYYRGVVVEEMKHSFFNYNVLASLELTEDRTLKYAYNAREKIGRALALCEEPKIINALFTKKDTYENDISFKGYWQYSPYFLAKLEAARTRRDSLPVNLWELARALKIIPSLPEACKTTLIEDAMLQKAKAFLAKHDFPITAPVIITDQIGNNGVMGTVSEEHIVIAKRCFANGTKYLAATLLEEQMHITEAQKDESRNFQDRLLQLLVSSWEEMDGEPL